VTERETVAYLTGLVHTGERFLHVRFGDGDVFFATGTGPKVTADGETWSRDLQLQLRDAWQTLARYDGTLLVGDVESYAQSDGCEPEWLDLVAEAEDIRGDQLHFVHMEALRVSFGVALPFYQAVAETARRKVYVAPGRLAGAARMLRAEHVEVPLHVAWEGAYETAQEICRRVDDGADMVLFSAGRGGKIMQGLLSVWRPHVTQVDVGSGLDVLFTDLRRGTDRSVAAEIYRRAYQDAGLL
jgi:hypothetical protein